MSQANKFRDLLANLVAYARVWDLFYEFDASGDRRLDLGEFTRGCAALGVDIPASEIVAEFDRVDANGGGLVLFDEFAAFAGERCVVSGVPVELAKVENVEFFESLRSAKLAKYCEDFGLPPGSEKDMARDLFATLFPEKA